MPDSQNPSVILSDDSSPFKGAEIAVAPTEHCNAIAGITHKMARRIPPNKPLHHLMKGKI